MARRFTSRAFTLDAEMMERMAGTYSPPSLLAPCRSRAPKKPRRRPRSAPPRYTPGAKRFAGDDLATTMKKNAELRVAQARALLSREAAHPRVVLAGDFNEGSDGAAVLVLK